MVSVVCPVYNEERYIGSCIESILSQDYPKDDIEVIFVDGMSSDKTRSILGTYMEQYPFLKLLDNPQQTVPYAMNRGIEFSKGDIIIRLDAHAIYEKNYFSVLVNSLKELGADNVGSVCHTDVLNKNPKSLAIKEVLSNKFGVGDSVFRTGSRLIQEVDTVPFGCWRREVFSKYGLYDVRLTRNQDIEFNSRILNAGGKIYIIPNTSCTYLAREKFVGIFKNNFLNGKWNVLTVLYTKKLKSLSIRHFVPLLFIISILLPCFFALIFPLMLYISALSLLLYITFVSFVSFKLKLSKKLSFIYLFFAFVVLHVSYGLGSLMAILNLRYFEKLASKNDV